MLKVPEGASPGTMIEFEPPGSKATPPPAPPSADAPSQPARLHHESKPVGSKLQLLERGLSNAVVERVYAVTVPEGHVPGTPLVAELENGMTLLVPTTMYSKARQEILFRLPNLVASGGESMDTVDSVQVVMKGQLKKKSPKGLPGVHAWQTRWFELTPTALMYWELSVLESAEKKGRIILSDVIGVRAHQVKKDDHRFDLLLRNKRLFELKSRTLAERDEWVSKLQDALLKAQPECEGGELNTNDLNDALPDVPESELDKDARTSCRHEEEEEDAVEDDPALDEDIAATMSFQTREAAKSMVAPPASVEEDLDSAGHDAQPVVVNAQYISRVARAKAANEKRKAVSANVASTA